MQDGLTAGIRAEIRARGGFLGFDRFMELALYAPGAGYYERREPFGAAGDFVTAPLLGDLLARALADTVEAAWRALGAPRDWLLVEQGGGAGDLLAQLLGLLDGAEPPVAYAVERSERLRAHQAARFGGRARVVAAPEEVPAHDAVVWFSNELVDALPVRVLVKRRGRLHARGVVEAGEGFGWAEGAPVPPPRTAAGAAADWPEGYLAEEREREVRAWRGALARVIRRGIVITVDYGYAAGELYRPTRAGGTLMAHRGHERREDVLADPGEQDITAHVDFTQLALAALETGFAPQVFTSQGAWIAHAPRVQARLAEAAAQADAGLLAAARRLVMPHGMGETFKLLADARGVALPLPWLAARVDRTARLREELRALGVQA